MINSSPGDYYLKESAEELVRSFKRYEVHGRVISQKEDVDMKLYKAVKILPVLAIVFLSEYPVNAQSSLTYKIVDTGQSQCYDTTASINPPAKGSPFYGQDAQYDGYQPSYTDNGDGTITDNVTGLMWSRSLDLNNDGVIDTTDKLTYDEAIAKARTLNLGGYTDWRVPTIKELYSLINFNGVAPSNTNSHGGVPFIDTTYFSFVYGDPNQGERIIDVQCLSGTKYVSTTMVNNETAFGVNFADGRIKGYPVSSTKKYFIRFVRGNPDYGINKFHNNNDGTVTDSATGLMWTRDDSKKGLNWEQALEWVQSKDSSNYLGYSDWRLPNVKELQSIVDYLRSPETTQSAAIDTVFNSTAITDEGGLTDYPFYWSSTTHMDFYNNITHGSEGDYVAFGEALGWMQSPGGTYQLMDVHGAGAQRTDPKAGNPADYPYGRGPQGDVVRIYNYVRLVRNVETATTNPIQNEPALPEGFSLEQNYPNPFNPTTVIRYTIPSAGLVRLNVYNILGQHVATLVDQFEQAGSHSVTFSIQGQSISSGIYFYRISTGQYSRTMKMVVMK